MGDYLECPNGCLQVFDGLFAEGPHADVPRGRYLTTATQLRGDGVELHLAANEGQFLELCCPPRLHRHLYFCALATLRRDSGSHVCKDSYKLIWASGGRPVCSEEGEVDHEYEPVEGPVPDEPVELQAICSVPT